MVTVEKFKYKTTVWNIQTEDDFYCVKYYEDDNLNDYWEIDGSKSGKIDYESELGRQLIDVYIRIAEWNI
jgi:hypothetical protein